MDYLCSEDTGEIMILCSNPREQYLSHRAEIDSAMAHVLENGQYILGNEVQMFEKEFSNYIGVNYGIGVGSGTEAIHLALSACGIRNGDEVITVSHTASATVAAIRLTGAVPVFVDIEPDFYTMDPTKIESAITPRTKAIIPVHIYGQSADIKQIVNIAKKYDLKVIEDCAQAIGTEFAGKKIGSYGDMACYSFYPTKNLGALGDGGMVVTNNVNFANKARLLREYGWAERYISHFDGWNTRLDELQAAVLRVKLKYLDRDNFKRHQIADLYSSGLKNINLILPKERENTVHSHHLYVIRAKKRNELISFLKENGILAGIHYPTPVHFQPAFSVYSKTSKLLETERVAKDVISLPLYPELKESDVNKIIETVKSFYEK